MIFAIFKHIFTFTIFDIICEYPLFRIYKLQILTFTISKSLPISQAFTSMFEFSPILKAEPHQSVSIESNLCKEECLDDRERWQKNQDQIIKQTVQKINKNLSEFCSFKVIDLNSTKFKDKYAILEIISFLIKQRSKVIQTNVRLSNYRRKSDQYLLQREEMLQKISKEQKAIENQKDLLTVKKQNIQRLFKQSNQKLASQKDQILKQLKKIQAREKAFEAQFRKKDNQIKFLQDGIKKIQQKSHSKNHFQLIQRAEKSKQKQKFKDGTDQYNNLALFQVEENIKSLSRQNNALKEFFFSIQDQLNQAFQLVNLKEKIHSNQKTIKEDGQFIFQITKPQVFKSQLIWQKQKFDELCKNIRKLRFYIQQNYGIRQEGYNLTNFMSNDLKNHKIKNLLQNYKQIVVSQDQVLNKIIMKSQFFEQKQNQLEKVCSNDLDDLNFDKIRALIQDQLIYVESKNKQLLSTKQKLSRELAKAQKIKGQILEQKMSIFQV